MRIETGAINHCMIPYEMNRTKSIFLPNGLIAIVSVTRSFVNLSFVSLSALFINNPLVAL